MKIKNTFIHTIKGIAIGLVLVIGISYVQAAWAPPAGAPSEANNAPAPINVGEEPQTKIGDLTSGTVTLFNSGLLSDGLGTFTGNGLQVGGDAGWLAGASSPESDIRLFKLSRDYSDNESNFGTTYSTPVCADQNGKLMLCGATPPAGAPTVTFTFGDGTTSKTFNNPENDFTANSNNVTLTWSLAGTTGSTTCTASAKLSHAGTDTSTTVSWTGSKSIAGGTSVGTTVKKFGTTEYKLVCDNDGNMATTGDQATKTVTARITGSLNKGPTAGSPYLSLSEFNNVPTLTIVAIGAGGSGGGASASCVDVDVNGGDTQIYSEDGTVNIWAYGGTGSCADSNVPGAGGAAATYQYAGKNGTTGTVSTKGCGGVPYNTSPYYIPPYASCGIAGIAKSAGWGGDGASNGEAGGGAGSYYTHTVTNPVGENVYYTVGTGGTGGGAQSYFGGHGSLTINW